MTPKFDIILSSCNDLAHMKQTVGSIFMSVPPSDLERFIIVEQGRMDAELKEFYMELTAKHGVFLVICPENRGWAQGINNAIGLSRAPYLFLAAAETIYNRDFHITMLAEFEKDPTLGLQPACICPEGDAGWMLSKRAMEQAGLLPELGVGFDLLQAQAEYIKLIERAGFRVGTQIDNLVTH